MSATVTFRQVAPSRDMSREDAHAWLLGGMTTGLASGFAASMVVSGVLSGLQRTPGRVLEVSRPGGTQWLLSATRHGRIRHSYTFTATRRA